MAIHHGDNPLLRPTEIKIATKPLPSLTNREYQKLVGVKTISFFVQRGSALLWLVDDRAFLRPLIWCVPTRWSATRLSTKVPPASRVSPPPEEHQIGTRKKHAPEGHHMQPTIPLPRPQPTSWLHLLKVGPADPPERPG